MEKNLQTSGDNIERDKIERQINMGDSSLYIESQHIHYGDHKTLNAFPQLPFPKPDPYLSRQIFKRQDVANSMGQSESCNLLTELERNPRIVLLSDAGMGKSIELEWICHELQESRKYSPIYKRLSNYQKSQTYLTDLPYITPVQDEFIILVLDGLDEVNIEIATLAVRQFTDDHPGAKVLVSCRSNAYANTLLGFEEYYLAKLSYQQIEQYLQDELGHFSNTFLEFWRKRDPWNPNQLIDNPFFLVRICEFLKDKGNQLPQSPGEVFEHLIEKCLDSRIPKRSNFDDESLRKACRKSLEKLAFIMECQGENVISKTDLEHLIEDSSEREVLLAKSSLIEFQNDSWRFTHNNFQEYLAAKVLSQAKSFKDIQQAVAAKPNDDHLNWSWTNTLSFLLGLWNDNAPFKRKLLDWLAVSDLDALIKIASFERETISSVERDNIFRRVFEACKKEDIIVGYRHYKYWDLAELGESPNTVRFLIDELKTARTPTVRNNTLLLLNNIRANIVPRDLKGDLRKSLFSNIYNFESNTPSIRHSAMETLFHLFDDLTKEESISIVDVFFDSKNTEEREPTYYLIEKQQLQIKYMDRLLRRTIEINDEGWRGDTFLTNEGSFIKKCFEGLNTEDEIVVFFESYPKIIERWNDDRRDSLPKSHLLEKANVLVISREGGNRIFEAMKQKLYDWMEYHIDLDKNLVIKFIEKFGFRLIFFQYCVDMKALPMVAIEFLDEQGVKYLAQKWNRGDIDEQYLENLIGLTSFNKLGIADLLVSQLNKVAKKSFSIPDIKPQKDHNQLQENNLLTEKRLYFNQDKIIGAIEEIFTKFGMEKFDKDEIYKIEHALSKNDEEIYYKYPHALIQFINAHHSKKKNALIEIVAKNWDWISVSQIRAFLIRNKKEIEINPALDLTLEEIEIVKAWCDNYLPTIDFQKQIMNGTSVLAWYMVKYRFTHYSERVYLQMIAMGLQRQIGSELNIIEFVKKYTTVPWQNLKTKVLDNLKNGKVKGDDIDSHLKFIQDHHIVEALGFLDFYIENKIEVSDRQRNLALEVYISLGGSTDYLYKLLKELAFIEGDSRESTLLNYCCKKNDMVFQKILQEKLDVTAEKERQLRYAVCLFNTGNLVGLQFLVNYTATERKSPFPFHSRRDINFENPKGISLLLKLFDLSHDQSIPQDAFNRISDIARNILLQIAACQQRKYFRRVQSAIQRFFNWHIWLNKLPAFLKKRLYVAHLETLKRLQYLLKDLEFQHYQKQEVTIEEAIQHWRRLSPISKKS